MNPDRIERALAEATREARSEAVPAIDWEAVEERLPMTRIATIPPRPFSYRPYAFGAAFALGAAAVVGFGFGGQEQAATPARVATTRAASPAVVPARTGELDGNGLAPGTRVSAGDEPQRVVHHGHVTWTLAPHSTAVLIARGDVVGIRLEAGSVTSRVVKSSRVETFAVEAADVRVAAHGTEFVVTLGADGVSVSVTEGTVLVGPREEPGVGQFVSGRASKRFTLAGKPLEDETTAALGTLRARRPDTAPAAPEGDASTNVAATASADGTGASNVPGDPSGSGKVASVAGPSLRTKPKTEAAAPAPSEELPSGPERPSAEALESSTRAVIGLAAACFKQRTATSDGVRIMAQTTVTFRTSPEGGMKSVDFEPPLSPWVQVCVNAGMGGIKTEATRYGFQVSRTVDLER